MHRMAMNLNTTQKTIWAKGITVVKKIIKTKYPIYAKRKI